jgi:hypothetical protein
VDGTPKIVVNGVPYDLAALQSVSVVPPASANLTSDPAPQP